MTARTFVVAALASAALALPVARGGEPTGTVTSDAAALKGRYVVENPTDKVIHYEVQWGSKGEWLPYTIRPGHQQGHAHVLDKDGRAPTPSVRWDTGASSTKPFLATWQVKFGRVGYTGFNTTGYVDEAIHYQFGYGKDKRLDLNAK